MGMSIPTLAFVLVMFTGTAFAQHSYLWEFNATTAGYGGIVQGGVTVADVNGDGKLEALAGSGGYWLYCLNGVDGTIKWVFGPTNNRNLRCPMAADINQDGITEVVVCDDKGWVWALSGPDGKEIWRFAAGTRTRVAPAIWDVNKDGKMEVIIASDPTTHYCLDGVDGSIIWNTTIGGSSTEPVIADVNGDGKWEIVAKGGADTYLLEASTGAIIWKATISYLQAAADGTPAVYDANGDGILDIVVCGGRNITCVSGDGRTILWKHAAVAKCNAAVVIADVNLDGAMEAVATTYDVIGTVLCYELKTGKLLWNFSWPGLFRYTNPAPVDVTGDGEIDLTLGSMDGNLVVINALAGTLAYNVSVGDDICSMPAVADVNGDGRLEIVFGSHNGNVYALKTPVACAPNQVKWGIFHYDNRNTGVLPMAEALWPGLLLPIAGHAVRRKRGR